VKPLVLILALAAIPSWAQMGSAAKAAPATLPLAEQPLVPRLAISNLEKDFGPYTIWWGHANSPVLYKDLLISVCMQDSLSDMGQNPATSYVIAHDKRTGKVVWQTPRMTPATAEQCDSYTTPIFQTTGNRTEMIALGVDWIDAYDPATLARVGALDY